MAVDTIDLVDNVDVTTALLSNPLDWRIRAVEQITLESASSCIRTRSLQVAPLQNLLATVVHVGAAKHALMALNVAPMPRGPLLDFDVTGPAGTAFLLPRLEIANREAVFLAEVAKAAGVPVDSRLQALLEGTLGFSQVYGLQSTHAGPLKAYLEDGTGLSVSDGILEDVLDVGRQCQEILAPRADANVEVNATQQPALVIPDLLNGGHVSSMNEAYALVLRYRDWLMKLSASADAHEPNYADDALNSLADYGAHYDLMAAFKVPLDEPFLLKYSERRSLDINPWSGRAAQSLVIADAASNHVALRVIDPNVRIVEARALASDGLPAFGAFIARASQQVYAFYASSQDREYRVDLSFRLAPLLRLQLVPYLVAVLLGLLALGLVFESVTTLRDAALVAGPAALAASVLLAREPSTLGSRLRVASSVAVLVGLVSVVAVATWRYVQAS